MNRIGRVLIPRLSLANIPGCRAVLLPLITPSGALSWDSGRYQSIAAVGESILHHCVNGAGIPGMPGTGGIEVAGN